MPASKKKFLALTATFLASVSFTHAQTLLLSYNFEETAGNYASTGTVTDALVPSGSDQTYGAAASGVGGSRAWDASATSVAQGLGNARLAHAADTNAVDALGAFTIAFWYNADVALASNTRMVYNRNSAGTLGYSIQAQNANTWQLTLGDGATATTLTASSATYGLVDTWVFFAVTFDSATDEVDFYAGTQGSAAEFVQARTFTGVIGNDASAFTLGNIGGATDRGFDGLMDNFQLYDGVLSTGQLNNLSAIPEPSTAALLIAGGALAGIAWFRRRKPASSGAPNS